MRVHREVTGRHGLALTLLRNDVSDPTRPVLIGNHDTEGLAYDIDVADDIVYLALAQEGVAIIDASTPSGTVLLATHNAAVDVRGVHVAGNRLLVASALSSMT